jgi:ketosteroid isomerase-like protein
MMISRLGRAASLSLFVISGAVPANAESPEDLVRVADQAFYQALSGRDLAAMMTIWADKPYVVSIGPRSKGMDVGAEAVRKYWAGAFDYFSQISAAKTDARVRIDGNIAWVMGTETATLQPKNGSDVLKFNTFVTHIFEKDNAGWKLVVHHAQMIPK